MIRRTIFGKRYATPNLYIGGVGASTVTNASTLATKLGIVTARVTNFQIIGTEVRATITGGSYTIPQTAFSSNTEITYFNDVDGLCTSVSGNSFNNSTLQYAIFPNCTTFGYNSSMGAFQSCTSLVYVTAPNLTTINQQVFSGCTMLNIANYPLITGVGIGTFQNCSSLVSINYPSCTSIGNNGFSGCTALSSVSLSALTTVGTNTFLGCTGLVSISLPLLNSANTSTFNGCTSLITLDTPSLQNLPASYCINCTALTTFNMSNVLTIGATCFRECNSLANVNLPNCTQIGSQAFYNCNSLVSFSAPLCTSVLGTEVFRMISTTSVTSIYLPSCTQLGTSVANNSIFLGITTNCTITVNIFLYDCNAGLPDADLNINTANIVYSGTQPAINTKIGGVGATINTQALLATRLNIQRSRITNIQIVGADTHFTVVGTYTLTTTAFDGNTNITYFEDTTGKITSLAAQAFRATVNMIYGIFNGVTSTGSGTGGTFQNATSLQYVTMPNLVTIGNTTFSGCSALNTVSYPLATSIGNNAFLNCTSLVTLTFPEVLTIGSTVFQGCTSLKNFSAAKATTAGGTGGNTFRSCTSIETINIPKCTALAPTALDNNNFLLIKTGCVISVNVALQTNNAGGPDGDLVYAVGTRGATVNYIP